MLSLSQTTGYAILALTSLESSEGHFALTKEIAGRTGVPLPYLSKILHALGRKGLIHSKRGYRGGFVLSRPAKEISLLDIAEAVDGQARLRRCLLGLEECSNERACPMHEFWKQHRDRIEQELQQTSLADVADFERQVGSRRIQMGSCAGEQPDLVCTTCDDKICKDTLAPAKVAKTTKTNRKTTTPRKSKVAR